MPRASVLWAKCNLWSWSSAIKTWPLCSVTNWCWPIGGCRSIGACVPTISRGLQLPIGWYINLSQMAQYNFTIGPLLSILWHTICSQMLHEAGVVCIFQVPTRKKTNTIWLNSTKQNNTFWLLCQAGTQFSAPFHEEKSIQSKAFCELPALLVWPLIICVPCNGRQ